MIGDSHMKKKVDNVIEVLYTDHCPFWKEVVESVKEILEENKIQALVKKVRVATQEEAERLRFPGSPTVRINGADIDPTVKETKGVIGCRVYTYEGKLYEYPPKDMIAKAVKRLTKS
jgi:hypothetical protein